MMLTALAATLLLAPAPVEPPPDTPKGPPPRIVTLQPSKGGHLTSFTTRTEYVIEFREVLRNNKGGVIVKAMVPVTIPRQVTVAEAWDLSKATITEAGGKKLDAKEMAKRVTGPTVVVVSTDGKPVDKGYLKLFDRRTLVVVPLAPPGRCRR